MEGWFLNMQSLDFGVDWVLGLRVWMFRVGFWGREFGCSELGFGVESLDVQR